MDGARIPFEPDDEAKIASAATWGSIVSITSIIGGGLSLATMAMAVSNLPEELPVEFGTAALVVNAIGVVFLIVINVWLLQACVAFRKVALTDEADQAYLLAGFRKLRAYFMLQVVLIIAMFGLTFVGAFAGAMFI